MNEGINWRELRATGQAQAEEKISAAAAKDSVSRDFYSAALVAMRSAQQDDLYPEVRAYGETRYTPQQGLKAACHAREDVTAILVIQQSVLRRLQGLRVLAWVCLAVLGYVAARVS